MNLRVLLSTFSLFLLSPVAAWADGPLKDPIAQQVDGSGKIIVPLLALTLLSAIVVRFSKNKIIRKLHQGIGLIAGLGVFGHAVYALSQMGFEKPGVNITGMVAAIAVAIALFSGFRKMSPAFHRIATVVLIAGFVGHKALIA
ncbi:hypothetical protein [Heliophilum fasciatum]|uniref:Uncharacterized protein n=1 Tax=Heliophilum fasciatum TaxID=35700 RepID=A0A4R2RYH6_9FIRM|nr:hypothetical protein [Heliophilum fasciatum]MCW2276887.1 presenilin-like A22 family membrane protease [Heliophilum fasciatum]TCP68653.1 hypothetical protein EDD73_10248 [Heliophilum fasciatum]